MPLFALGVSQALVSYYMDWDTTRHEVKKICFLFCVGAVLTVIVHAIAHTCFGIIGVRLTLRVREMMFSGNQTINQCFCFTRGCYSVNMNYNCIISVALQNFGSLH